MTAPETFAPRGAALWLALEAGRDLTGGNFALAVEACRIADRLDGLDRVIQGKGVLNLMHFRSLFDLDDDDKRHFEMKVDGVFAEARQQANILRQIVAGLPVRGDDDHSEVDEFLDGLGD